ncbi:MAG: VWA domain-containing protein [Firmicutes bacterium]|nr:VWA domain-containing protein [Bacillota bacterium]
MGVSFNEPLWWLLFPLLALAAWYLRLPWLRMTGPARRREKRRLVTRLVILLLLTAALAGPSLITTINRQAVVLTLDVSASVGPALSAGEEWTRNVLEVRPAGTTAGVVAFGSRAVVEEPPGLQPAFYRSATDPGREASNVGEALRFARAMLPGDTRQRVVLLTDGRDTGGDAVAVARTLYAAGTRVDVVPVGTAAGSDIRLDQLNIPPRSRAGENTLLEAVVNSDVATQAELFLERDGAFITKRAVELRAGENRLTLSVPAGEAGMHRYRARVTVRDRNVDAFTANNEAGAVQEVAGPPGVLVVSPTTAEVRSLVNALRAAGRAGVEVAEPAAIPRGAMEWARYQTVFLVNTPAFALGETVMAELESYVRDGGGGLVMVGGPDSYGPGGYAGTPVERALPVEMDIRGQGEMPSLGLILVIDKSGSMSGAAGGARKIALAREAAARSISVLTGRDRAGLLAFDSLPWWVVPPGPVDDKEELRRVIESIQAGGGTEIYPPLLGAYQALRDMPTRVKHIILLSDGMSASGGDYQTLLKDIRSAGITLSTVAVGEGADGGMLQALAEMGRGRFYAVADAENIPSIFTKETMMATRNFAVNERFYPQAAGAGTLLRGLETVPPLDGYITVTPKDLGETPLVSHRGDPVLAAWQYGLGRAVAWTPDAGGRWSTVWAGGHAFPRLWGNVLSWILPAENTGSLYVEAGVVSSYSQGQGLEIRVEDPGDWQQVRQLNAVVTGPDGTVQTVPLEPSGPGRYQVRHHIDKPGAYLVGIKGDAGGRDTVLARGGAVAPYPPEYRETGINMESLRAIAAAGGGAVLEKPEQAFADNLPSVQARRDLAPFLLALAALLWLVDVAGRRLVFGDEERAALRRLWQSWSRRLKPAPATKEGGPAWTGRTLSRLQNMRRSRDETHPTTGGNGDARGNPAPPPSAAPAETPVVPGSATMSGGNANEAGLSGGAGPGASGSKTAPASDPMPEPPKETASRLLAAKRRRDKDRNDDC